MNEAGAQVQEPDTPTLDPVVVRLIVVCVAEPLLPLQYLSVPPLIDAVGADDDVPAVA